MKKYFLFVIFAFLFSTTIKASEPAIWTINTREDVLKGESRGVSIDETGAISLAPNLAELFNSEQSYIWSSATDASGNTYLGTGSDGKIFKVDANGKGAFFADLNELNVAALAIGKAGELYAGTSPDGKVYRIEANGTSSVFFDPKEKYIWSLAVLADGSLAVGTGENGKIYKVRSANAAAENSLFFDTSETHIISLAADRQGNLYAGTDSNGLVLRFSPDGKPFALLDSPLREIHDLEIGADGSVYALALSETIAAAKTPTPTATPTPKTTNSTNSKTPKPVKSRYDLSAAKSAVYRILPDGGNDVIWNSSDVAAFSLYAHLTGNGVLVGTSDKGRIYSITNDGNERLVLQTDENQVSTIFTFNRSLYATTSNQGKIFRFGGERAREGIYESPVLDANAAASWGRIWWRSEGSVEIQTRSGNTETPDETWSAWSGSLTDQKGAQVSSPTAKFLQWRAVLKNSDAKLSEVNVSYLPRNIAPEILSIEILPTNIGLQPNPPVQIDPNIETSGLDPATFGIVIPPVVPRKIYQRGARSITWNAEDRNGDKLEYAVYYREANENAFKLLKENLTENFYTIDGFSLADGRYIFKIVATDAVSNPSGLSLSDEKLSEPFEIDNSAPTVSAIGQPQISGDKARVVFEATDAASFLQKAEYSINGGEWKTVYSDDGISDSPRERYTMEIPVPAAGEYSVALRVFDANGNVGNARILIRK